MRRRGLGRPACPWPTEAGRSQVGASRSRRPRRPPEVRARIPVDASFELQPRARVPRGAKCGRGEVRGPRALPPLAARRRRVGRSPAGCGLGRALEGAEAGEVLYLAWCSFRRLTRGICPFLRVASRACPSRGQRGDETLTDLWPSPRGVTRPFLAEITSSVVFTTRCRHRESSALRRRPARVPHASVKGSEERQSREHGLLAEAGARHALAGCGNVGRAQRRRRLRGRDGLRQHD